MQKKAATSNDIYLERAARLHKMFEDLDKDTAEVVGPLINEVVSLEKRMDELRALPFLRVSKTDNSFQKATPAAKLYKECSQSYMNGIRILTGILKKADVSAEDNLMRQLEEFMV